MTIKKLIKNFYDEQSEKRNTTRQKIWPEYKIILEEIKNHKNKDIKILDLGCGNANILSYLNENNNYHNKNIKYIWWDISNNLIQIAKNNHPESIFYSDDMIEILKKFKQEEFDFVIMIASFQHIDSEKERLLILKNIYRILKFKWKLISINWCFSKWFIKKYKKEVWKSLLKSIFTLNYLKYNDIYIPWKWENKIYYRYYHIFNENEKSKLIKLAWFVSKNPIYLDKKWNNTNLSNWRNSIFIAKKDIFK